MSTFNDFAARATISYGVQSLIDGEHKIAQEVTVTGTDAGSLAILADRFGDVAASVWRGGDLVADLLRLSGTAQAWCERIERQRAAS